MQEQKLHGFIPVRTRAFAELDGTLREYVHEKTGAQLCWLDRKDENKTFSIAFKTLPEDSTGVFHILEHSVLCGSDKYPVKEPFVELLKSSVQTFLNAMTYPDKTVYPVSSRNDRDLLNLMDVYLDAVFHPAIYRKPEIFRQEGWRFEGEGESVCRQGVVFNEMKGAFASPERILDMELDKLLYPDNCYGFVSGGDPAHIPELSYEQFIANHRKYYHPSNARISLVGSVDLEACLEKIDSFLQDYDRQALCFDIPMQQPGPARRSTVEYAIGPEEDPAGRTIVSNAALLCAFDDDLRNDAFSVLADYLTGDDEAPLKRAVLDADLAQDFEVKLEDGIQQSYAAWVAWNTDPDKQPALERTVRETLDRLVNQGLDRDRLEACFRRHAFEQRDRDSGYAPRSLSEALDMLDTWLYGGDPAQGLLAEDALGELGKALATDFPERLLREIFLENEHSVTVTLVPSVTLSARRAEQEQANVRAITAAWTEADWAAQAEQAETLRLWQQTPDSEAALATIPMLRIEDLAQAPAPLGMTETRLGGLPLLRHKTGSKLAFLRAHFEASDLKLEELPVLSVLCELLGAMGTARYDRTRLPLELMRTVGRINVKPAVVECKTPDRCRVFLSAVLACLPELGEKAAALLGEILTATHWDDLPMLRDNLQQMALNAQMALSTAGHRYGVSRLGAGITAHGAAQEYTAGVEYVRWLKRMSTADDETLRGLLRDMEALNRRLAVRERMILSANEQVSEAALEALRSAIPVSGQPVPGPAVYALPGARREGVGIPAAVGFACMGSNLLLHGRKYHGSFPVLTKVLNYTYLWSEIRVQGGAYGCGFSCKASGDLGYYTYRDPQPARSLGVMKAAPAYLRSFCAENPDLTGFILGSVSAMDPLRGEEETVSAGEKRWIRDVTEEDVCRLYDQLLHTTPADLLALIPALEELAAEQAVCVTAGKPLLEACELERVISV
jgi:Zn-dependent M16 (insulinase) family peptidase